MSKDAIPTTIVNITLFHWLCCSSTISVMALVLLLVSGPFSGLRGFSQRDCEKFGLQYILRD